MDERAIARYWSKVRKTNGCWTWTAGCFPNGYGMFYLRGKTVYAHRIGWELANGTIPDGMLVCHRCDNPPCVRPDHLFLGSCTDNMQDAVKKGRMATGDRSGRRVRAESWSPDRIARGARAGGAKFTDETVTEIRRLYFLGATQPDIAKRFGVTRSLISTIVNWKTWTHVGTPPRDPPRRRHSRAKLTENDVREIRRRYAIGDITQRDLGAEFGVAGPVVSQIVSGKLWRHVV